jgi:ABC-type phosphate/phosphonate transport system substrate-binding protein
MKKTLGVVVAGLIALCFSSTAIAQTLNLVITSSADPKKEGAKYELLGKYIKAKSGKVDAIQLRVAKDYAEAASLFQAVGVDGMFSGSFLGAVLVKKGLAKPVARPLRNDGTSTYYAVVIAREGTAPFTGIADFKGKRVAYAAFASSGEYFVRSYIPRGGKPEDYFTPVPAASHLFALNALVSGAADYAVVKNTIWDPAKFKGMALVGKDSGENPDGTLVLTPAAYEKYGVDVLHILLGLEKDQSEIAAEVRKAFDCKSFIATTPKDFEHTIGMLGKSIADFPTYEFRL